MTPQRAFRNYCKLLGEAKKAILDTKKNRKRERTKKEIDN